MWAKNSSLAAILTIPLLGFAGCAAFAPPSPPQRVECPPGVCCANGLPVACWDSLNCYGFTPTQWRRWPTECEPPTAQVCPVPVPAPTRGWEADGPSTAVPPPPPAPFVEPTPSVPPGQPPNGTLIPMPPPPKPEDNAPGILPETPKIPLPPQPQQGDVVPPDAHAEPTPADAPMPPGNDNSAAQAVRPAPASPVTDQFDSSSNKLREPKQQSAEAMPGQIPPQQSSGKMRLMSFSPEQEDLPPAPLPEEYLPVAPLP